MREENDRIGLTHLADEEKHLIAFFGNDYVKYRVKTWIGIPFIN